MGLNSFLHQWPSPMKVTQLLSTPAAAIAMKGTISSAIDQGWCQWNNFLGNFESPYCMHGTTGLKETIPNEEQTADSLWPIATPCVIGLNGTEEYCVFSNPGYAGDTGVSILTTPAEAIEIAKGVALTNPSHYMTVKELNSEESHKWRVEESPGKGMGLVASQNLHPGDHIMSASAAIMLDFDLLSNIPEETLLEMQAKAIDYLPRHARSTFLNLSTHDAVDNYEMQVSKIILTNGFEIVDTELLHRVEGEETKSFLTVFPLVSRMNHDCRPNAHYYWDPDTFTQNVFATRPIAAGEEITITYVDPFLDRQSRQELLAATWHFACSCSLCSQHPRLTAESDARIAQIQYLQKLLGDYTRSSHASPEMAELLISLYEQERLQSRIYEAYMYAAVEYNGAGEPWQAIKYARLAIQHGFIAGGPTGEDHYDLAALAADPWEHWSWMMRRRSSED